MLERYRKLLQRVSEEHSDSSDLTRDSKVLLVDGMNLFIRDFSAIPSLNTDGQHVGGTIGFLKSLGSVSKMLRPTRIIIVFDGVGGSTKRRKLYSGYKSGRSMRSRLNRASGINDVVDENESMTIQFERLFDYLRCLPVTVIMIDSIEADDVIAYLTTKYFSDKTYILSGDRDFLQLVNDRVGVYLPTTKKLYDVETVNEEFGLHGNAFTIWKCIMGDRSDDISGVNGVGKKLLEKHADFLYTNPNITVDEFLSKCEEKSEGSKPCAKIVESASIVHRNYQLMQLHDVEISGKKMSAIRNIASGDIHPLDISEFKNLVEVDKVHHLFSMVDLWLKTSFDHVDKKREDREE